MSCFLINSYYLRDNDNNMDFFLPLLLFASFYNFIGRVGESGNSISDKTKPGGGNICKYKSP